MLSLKECQKLIDTKLNVVDLPAVPVNLYEPIRYMLELGAKRLRPSLVLMACNVFSDQIDQAFYPALAIELFHNFTLMHDDIMDNSDMRRNQPTVHVKWNSNVAILSGDAMLIKAYELLSMQSADLLHRTLPVFNATALQVCEGQQWDMDYEHTISVTKDDYLRMVEYKTAALLAASLKIGAIAGGAGTHDADLLYNYGRNIGIAFQLRDDWLDVFADQAVFGKMIGNDIVANKKTMLLIEALHTAKDETRTILTHWLERKSFNRDEKIVAIKSIYVELKTDQVVAEMIRHYHQLALQDLEALPVDRERKSELVAFTDYLMGRKK
jgi:geranylgeranyl diphosphate synthase type II